MSAQDAVQRAANLTQQSIRQVTTDPMMLSRLQQLSHLNLPEIDELTQEVARVVPAGNVPGVIISGLARLDNREIDPAESRKHVGLLFKGLRQTFDKAVYGAFFAVPAAVLHGYQLMLKLTGKDISSAFPDGTWQFYLEFALREDSARHANETTGFHSRLAAHRITLRPADALATWMLASAYFLQMLPAVLANEWRERMAVRLLLEEGGDKLPADLYTLWEAQRPFQRGADAGAQEDFAAYRRRRFESFIEPYVKQVSRDAVQRFHVKLDAAQARDLPKYQRQMSWLAYLQPDAYQELRTPYAWEQTQLGVIYHGRYHLLPIQQVLDVETARRSAVAILEAGSPPDTGLDEALALAQRAEHPGLRANLDANTRAEIDQLRFAPILLNWDERDIHLPLSLIRRGKRGVGDHALTIFRTQNSIVFDQSHIFFDGAWGSAVAEMMTGEALSWAQYMAQLPAVRTGIAPQSLNLSAKPAQIKAAQKLAIVAETGAENTSMNLNAILRLRKLLKQRSDLASVTVNDMMILYRGLHALTYEPSPALAAALDALGSQRGGDAQLARKIILEGFALMSGKNPAVLIPIDASRHDPRERLFPTTFRNPFTDFYDQHRKTMLALRTYKMSNNVGQRGREFKAFHDAQVYYLRLISGFGELLSRYRTVALSGQSISTASIKFLANMHPALQKLLDTIPGKFDVLNEVIKGEEVFSNMGRVAKGSTLRRFITAKDDNAQKTLAWGVLTDDSNVVHLSLRDFRPHVGVLQKLGMDGLAQQIAQDYLDAYASGLNQYVAELTEITVASRETMGERR